MYGALYAEYGQALACQGDGPFWPAQIISQTRPSFDDGGSLVVSEVGPWKRDCVVQIDAADTAMRAEQGFAEGDRRFIVPAGALSGPVTTDHRIDVRSGPFAGVWGVESVGQNAVASQWVMRGRKA